MTARPQLPPDPPPDPDEEPGGEPGGSLRPTSGALLALWAGVGLVGGWLLRPVGRELLGTAPLVSPLQPLALGLVAVLLGLTAWLTWRAVHVRRALLEPDHAVNRLVLARASALVGALAAGGYAGYAVSWLGVGAERADERMWTSFAAAAAGIAVVVTALLLERACRVRSGDREP